jgi:uncharacterized protein YqeY
MMQDLFTKKMLEYAKSGQHDKLGVLRYFLSQVKNKEIELRPQNVQLNDEHIFKVLKKLIKQNAEAAEMYDKAGRADALAKAQFEKSVYGEFAEMFPKEDAYKLQ